jgi:hypothetical protein
MSQQIEFGEGRVWSFEASVATTSGVLVYFQGGKVRATTAASQHVAGVSLIPASAGRQISVGLEGVYRIQCTGNSMVAGTLLGAGPAGKAAVRTSAGANERRYDAAIILDATVANNARGKVKLLW